jgi:hypothetical protein
VYPIYLSATHFAFLKEGMVGGTGRAHGGGRIPQKGEGEEKEKMEEC